MLKRVLLFHPPTGLFQRQDRCQMPAEDKLTMEPPNELGYMAAVLELLGIECKIQDYPMIDGTREFFLRDLRDFKPGMIIAAATAATFDDDASFCKDARKIDKDIVTIIKAAYLTVEEAAGAMKRLPEIDIILLREYECSVKEIAECLKEKHSFDDVKGIVFRKAEGIVFSGEREFIQNLDELPFPARHLFKNELYIRPDTAVPQATIQTARGCPFECIFCLASNLEGKNARFRSPEKIILEMKECINKFGIKNFFLRADTFTFNKDWMITICKLIVKEGLDIKWVCNSRVDTIDEERLKWMKKAGCWLVSLGIESGNQNILDRMRKGITLDDSKRAVALCRRYGIKSYCFYILGMPWDTYETISDTIRFAKELNGDFFLFHIAVPFAGTELYEIAKKQNLLTAKSLYGYSYFEPSLKTPYLSLRELKSLWKRANWAMYLYPAYIRQLISEIDSPGKFVNYARYAYGKLKALI